MPPRQEAASQEAWRGGPFLRFRLDSALAWFLTFPQNAERDASALRHFLGTSFVPYRREHDAFMSADVVQLRVKLLYIADLDAALIILAFDKTKDTGTE